MAHGPTGTELSGGFLAGSLVEAQAASTFSTPTIGTQLLLLGPGGRQSAHGSREALTGELALLPPMLGSSQRLMNRSHHEVYYQVSARLAPPHPTKIRASGLQPQSAE